MASATRWRSSTSTRVTRHSSSSSPTSSPPATTSTSRSWAEPRRTTSCSALVTRCSGAMAMATPSRRPPTSRSPPPTPAEHEQPLHDRRQLERLLGCDSAGCQADRRLSGRVAVHATSELRVRSLLHAEQREPRVPARRHAEDSRYLRATVDGPDDRRRPERQGHLVALLRRRLQCRGGRPAERLLPDLQSVSVCEVDHG